MTVPPEKNSLSNRQEKMTLSAETLQNTYPLPAYNYRVTIIDGNSSPTINFSEVTGLSREYKTVIYKHGMSFAFGYVIIPAEMKPLQLTLKRGVIKNSSYASYLDDWFDSVKGWWSLLTVPTRDIQIDLCDTQGKKLISWKVIGAIPLKLAGPDFVASGQDVAIERLDIIAKNLEVDFNS